MPSEGFICINDSGGSSVEDVLKLEDMLIKEHGKVLNLLGICHRDYYVSAYSQMRAIEMHLVTPQKCGKGEGDFMWGGIPWKISLDCPTNEVHFMEGDRVVGKIVNIGRSKNLGGKDGD